MIATICSDEPELTTALARVLQELGIRHQATSLAVSAQELVHSSSESNTVFLASSSAPKKLIPVLRRLRTASSLRIVVVATLTATSEVVGLIREGAFDFVDIHGDLGQDIAGLWSRIKLQGSEPHVESLLIGVLPTGDISDSSLLAINLAASFAQESTRCDLLEMRCQTSDLAIHLKLNPTHTMSALLRQDDVDQHMYGHAFAGHESGIHLLPGMQPSSRCEPVDPESMCRLLDFAKVNPHPTVVCFDDIYEKNHTPLLMPLDFIVVPTRGDVASIWRTKQRIDWLSQNGFDPNHLIAMVFDDGTDAHADLDDVSRVLNIPRVRKLPFDYMENAISLNLGQPIAIRCPQNSMTKAIHACRDSISGVDVNTHSQDTKPFVHVRAAAAILLSAFARPY